MDIIQVEKSELFDWDDVLEIVVYYNESEIIRESVDFSTRYALFLPIIYANPKERARSGVMKSLHGLSIVHPIANNDTSQMYPTLSAF